MIREHPCHPEAPSIDHFGDSPRRRISCSPARRHEILRKLGMTMRVWQGSSGLDPNLLRLLNRERLPVPAAS
jgi:hypothetical protein